MIYFLKSKQKGAKFNLDKNAIFDFNIILPFWPKSKKIHIKSSTASIRQTSSTS